MTRKTPAYLLLLLLFFTACKHGPKNNVVPTTPVPNYMNVIYGADTVQQSMYVFLPAHRDTVNTPVVIFIHGGSWVAGSKDDFMGLGMDTFFNQAGCAVIMMSYRLVSTYKYPAPLDDVGLVMDYIKQKASDWQINPNRVCLFGKSSGSQLALLYAYTNNRDNRIKAVVDGFGPTNLTDTSIVNKSLGDNVAYMLGAYSSNMQTWHNASPLYFMQGAVPTVIYQGTADTLVYPIQSQMLQDSLIARGMPSMYISWPGDYHGWDQNQWLAWRQATLEWLKRFL